jgi:hypothetical protein
MTTIHVEDGQVVTQYGVGAVTHCAPLGAGHGAPPAETAKTMWLKLDIHNPIRLSATPLAQTTKMRRLRMMPLTLELWHMDL